MGTLANDRVPLSALLSVTVTVSVWPTSTSPIFTFDEKGQRAVNFYVWDSEEAAERFFSEELRERVTGLYGVAPAIEFVEIAEIVDNSAS